MGGEIYAVFGLIAFVVIGAKIVTAESKKLKQRRFAEFQEDEDRVVANYHGGRL